MMYSISKPLTYAYWYEYAEHRLKEQHTV